LKQILEAQFIDTLQAIFESINTHTMGCINAWSYESCPSTKLGWGGL